MRDWLSRAPVHPLLIALYPAVALLASNLGQVKPSLAGRALVISALIATVGLLAFWALTRSRQAAALLTSWGILLFFSYGHIYNALRAVEFAGTTLGRHRFLAPGWLLLAAGGAWLILKRLAGVAWLTPALNLTLGAALLLPIGQILLFQTQGFSPAQAAQEGQLGWGQQPLSIPAGQSLPDIYYIVLDAYTSADVLRESFDLDNGPFLESLRELGFYVADCSQSNYAQTELSLAATLNMDYLKTFVDESLPEEQGRRQLWPLLRHSTVRQLLEDLGYRTVAFETGYYWSEWEDADLYLAPDRGLFQGLSAFEATLLRSTAAWAIVDALPGLPAFLVRDLDRSAEAHRERLLFVLQQLEAVPDLPGPKFVFAHIVSPHRPFVFDAQGGAVNDDYDWSPSNLGLEAYQQGYREQLLYLNQRMESILRSILLASGPSAVIVVQGDHGPEESSSQGRMSILNAIHLEGKGGAELHRSLSPVNTFRVVFNVLFGTDLPLLEDLSYFSTYGDPFGYSVVAKECLE